MTGGSSGGSKSYDYFGDVAGIVCHGPVDELVSIVADGKLVWPTIVGDWALATVYTIAQIVRYKGRLYSAVTGSTGTAGHEPDADPALWALFSVKRNVSANPFPFTVKGFGPGGDATCYFYWGTTGQSLDATEAVMLANGHSNYRNYAFVVLKQFLFGRERVSAPSVECCVRRYPQQTAISSTYNALDAEGQANPAAALLDYLQHPVAGPAMANSAFDSATWTALATTLAAGTAKYYLSPELSRAQTVRQFMAELLGYYDGWLRYNSSGVIEAGMFDHQATAPTFTAATTIDAGDLIDEADFSTDSWATTSNEFYVTFSDLARGYKDGSSKFVNQSNRANVGEARVSTIQRKFITRRAQADKYAAEMGKIEGQPLVTGTLALRVEKAASILPGSWFLFTHDPLGMSIICRCMDKVLTGPPSGRSVIKYTQERALSAVPYRATPPNPAAGAAWATPEAVIYAQMWQVPPTLAGGSDYKMTVLAARRNKLTTGFYVGAQQADKAKFATVGEVDRFACFGTLTQTYNKSESFSIMTASRTSSVITITTSAATGYAVSDTIFVDNIIDASGNLVTALGPASSFTIASISGVTITASNSGPNFALTNQTNAFLSKNSSTMVCVTPDDVSETLRIQLPSDALQSDMDNRFTGIFSEDDINNATYLVIVFQAATPSAFEIMAIRECRLISGTTYAFKTRRAQFGTAQLNFATGDRAFVITRDAIETFSHALIVNGVNALDWTGYRLSAFNASSTVAPDAILTTVSRSITANVATLTCYRAHGFYTGQKVRITAVGNAAYNIATPVTITVTTSTAFTYACVAANEGTTADTGGIVDTTYQFFDPWPPVITWKSIKRNSVDMGAGYGSNSISTDVHEIVFQVDDSHADITDARLEVRNGSIVTPVYNQQFAPVARVTPKATFKLATGTWGVFAVVRDFAGRVVEKKLSPVAGGSDVDLPCVSAGDVATPSITFFNTGRSTSFNLASVTAGASIYYRLDTNYTDPPTAGTYAFGTAPYGTPPTGFTLWSAAVSMPRLPQTIQIVAQKSGLNDSQFTIWRL